MIVLLPNGEFLSEVSRAIEIADALVARGVPVCVASRGGAHVHLLRDAGHDVRVLEPRTDPSSFPRFVRALSSMDGSEPFFADDELARAVDAEVELFREVGAQMAVTGFTLSAYLSTRVAGIPLATDHGGSFVPPVLAHGGCPAPVNPPDPGLARLPEALQRLLANRVPALMRKVTNQLNARADALGVERIPGLLGLMCGDLTLITEVPEVLGLTRAQVEAWRPRWPFRLRSGTTFRLTGPMFARLDVALPPEVDAFIDGDEPVVLVVPTSVEESFLRELVVAARTAGAKILVGATVHDVGDLADDRTLVVGILPNHEVMARVAAAVIMGGQGSVQTAIATATPFVGVPLHGEQELNVAVAERLGMAVRMSPRDATTPRLGASLRQLLDDPSYAESARAASQHYDGVEGGAGAAEAIIDWLAGRQG